MNYYRNWITQIKSRKQLLNKK